MFSQMSVSPQLLGGYPLPKSGLGGTPFPGQDGGTPSHIRTGGGDTPFPGHDGGYPYPRSGWGVPHQQDGVPPDAAGWDPRSGQGVPPPRSGWGYPGYPHVSRMWVPPPPSRS